MRNNLEEIIKEIEQAQRILITSHENPDSDAIGSMLALSLGLKKIGKEVLLYNKDGVPEVLSFLKGSDEIVSSLDDLDDNYDLCFVLDCPSLDRPGSGFKEYISQKSSAKIIIVDHHETRGSEGDIRLIDTRASSTGVLIYSILKAGSIELDPDIAESIYVTILGDTGSFMYSNTNAETFRIAAELVLAGARPEFVSQALYENEPLRKIKLQGLVVKTLEIADENRIASVYIDREMYENSGTTKEDAEGMVNIPRSIKGVEVAFLLRQEDAKPYWKVSLRSKGEVDVSSLAQRFGGGGHKKAAGCRVSGAREEAMKKIYDAIKEALN